MMYRKKHERLENKYRYYRTIPWIVKRIRRNSCENNDKFILVFLPGVRGDIEHLN